MAAVILGAGVWYFFAWNGDFSNTNNANQVVANRNANTNTSVGQVFTHPTAGYVLRYPSGWKRISEGPIETFAPAQEGAANSCYLKISSAGLLGRGTDLQQGPDETITVAGLTATKRTWLARDGAVAYFNFELNKPGQLLGVEGSIGSNIADCGAVLDNIVSSLVL